MGFKYNLIFILSFLINICLPKKLKYLANTAKKYLKCKLWVFLQFILHFKHCYPVSTLILSSFGASAASELTLQWAQCPQQPTDGCRRLSYCITLTSCWEDTNCPDGHRYRSFRLTNTHITIIMLHPMNTYNYHVIKTTKGSNMRKN